MLFRSKGARHLRKGPTNARGQEKFGSSRNFGGRGNSMSSSGSSGHCVGQPPRTGDAVPGPLAFFALRRRHGISVGACKRRNAEASGRRFTHSRVHTVMPLAQSGKCRGLGGRAPMTDPPVARAGSVAFLARWTYRLPRNSVMNQKFLESLNASILSAY